MSSYKNCSPPKVHISAKEKFVPSYAVVFERKGGESIRPLFGPSSIVLILWEIYILNMSQNPLNPFSDYAIKTGDRGLLSLTIRMSF